MMLPQLLLITVLTWTTATGLPCAQPASSESSPLNVHSVKPSDVAVLCSIGHGHELSTVVTKTGEVIRQHNPELIHHLPDGANVNNHHGSLLEQAQEMSDYLLSNQFINVDKHWKLLLLFVQMDQLCACEPQQIQSVLKEAVQDVHEALQLLHSQLKQTLVSVALWDAEQNSKMCACMETISRGELKLQRAMMTFYLQESLKELMVKQQWYSDRDDFTVVLQDKPFIAEVSPAVIGTSVSEAQASRRTNELILQMWTNLLQPANNQQNAGQEGEAVPLPCPTEERPYLRTERNSHQTATLSLSPLSGSSFTCSYKSASSSVPTSVHKVRPADVKVVAAVGDSLTAGNGIGSSPDDYMDVLTQYRGLSWSIGGDRTLSSVTTLPNILRNFNSNLKGYSTGTGNHETSSAFFNQAIPGSVASDILAQVKTLVSLMKSDSRINYNSDWKVITVFVAGNDLCVSCQDSSAYSASKYISHLRSALDYLHAQVPRALVNLVEPLYVSPLRAVNQDSSNGCPTWLSTMLCPCVISPADGSSDLNTLQKLNRDYQSQVNTLVNSKRYDTRSDFTVVVQPFLRNLNTPMLNGKPDRSYFSADCFHLSQKSHKVMAISLWNNMMEAHGKKTTSLDFTSSPAMKCPSSSAPYIRTISN